REVQGGLEFRNELIRAQAYYAIPTSGREHLHRAAAEALCSSSESLTGAGLEIAWHFIRGRAVERGVEYALRGAERCLERGAPHEAEQVLAAIVNDSASEQVVITITLAQALLDQSKGEAAAPLLERLWRNDELTVHDRAHVAAMRASAEYVLARETGAKHTSAAEEALSTAELASDSVLVAKALNVLSRAYGETGNADGLGMVQKTIGSLMQDPCYATLPLIHYAAGYCEYAGGSAVRAGEHVRRALELAKGGARPTDVVPLLNGLAVAHHHAGDLAGAMQASEEALGLARRIGDDSWSCTLSTNLCGLLVHEGRPDAALAYGKQAAQLARRALKQPRSVMTYTNLANAYLLSRDFSRALDCLEQANAVIESNSNWEPRIVLHIESACIWLALGKAEHALQSIAVLDGMVGELLFGPHWGALERLRAFRTARMGDTPRALEQARAARARFKGRSMLYYVSVNAAVAWLEQQVHGSICQETNDGLRLLDTLGLTGMKTLLTMEGFIPAAG
ncbi:MAG TPA: tetratricopeptide repeat protein, partial [Gemmatimonadales bacterium]|nr:tetratricopeptide repeat protein [Gemmatimonadales bacterium]